MDTLCIPVHSSKLAKSCRKKAIQLLGETFHEATAVLVLDRELEIVQSATAPFLELGLRILCSGWMKRLWTLQEAALASEARGVAKLYFQMRDGPFLYQNDLNSPEKRTAPIHDEEGSLLHQGGIEVRLWMAIPSVRSLREVPEGYSPFRFIHDAIEHRSTSKFEDVPLCLASLLGKDLTTIVSTSDAEQRMANLYMLMREVPTGMLWCSNSKLTQRPFRWAPKSIANCPLSVLIGWNDGICDTAGLHVRVGGFMFAESEIEPHSPGSMLPPVFNFVSAETGNVVGQATQLWMDDRESISLQQILALIPTPPDHVDNRHTIFAVIVAVEEIVQLLGDDGVHSTEYVCTIVGHADITCPRHATEVVLQGQMTMKDQRWCIT